MTVKSKTPRQLYETQEYRPEVVRILGRNFYVLYSSLTEGGMEQLGLTHPDEGIINIRNGQTPIEEKDTILHELIHVVDHLMGTEMNERQVTLLAHGLIGLFQDNQEFAEYIIKKVET
jgi:hypothetical protein